MLKRFWKLVTSQTSMALVALVSLFLAFNPPERKPELTVSVDTLAPVVDVHAPVGGLEVSFAGENLRASKKALWSLSVSFKNSGSADIRRGDYDERAPIGIAITGGDIVEVPTVQASSEYLREHARPVKQVRGATIPPVIIDPDATLKLNLLVLSPEDTRPAVQLVGKVAGVKTIFLPTPESRGPASPFWARVFQADSPLVHLARIVPYSIAGLLSLVLLMGVIVGVVAPTQSWTERKRQDKRRRGVRHQLDSSDLSDLHRRILGFIEDGDYSILHRLRSALVARVSDAVLQGQFKVPPDSLALRRAFGTIDATNGRRTLPVDVLSLSQPDADALAIAVEEVGQMLGIEFIPIERPSFWPGDVD